MDILGLELAGFRRFETASIDLLDHLLAVVGPNEAGKTSLLEALRRLNDETALPPSDLTRRLASADDSEVLTAWFGLDADDRDAISGIPETREIQRLKVGKLRNGTLVGRLDPPAERSKEPRRAALKLLRTVTSSSWAARNRSIVDESLAAATETLKKTVETLPAAELDQLEALGAQLTSAESSGNPARLGGLLRDAAKAERAPHPEATAVAILLPRRPEFLLFSQGDRELESVYDLQAHAANPPRALENFAELARLSLNAAAEAVNRGDYGQVEDLVRAADVELSDVFSTGWRQSVMEVQVRIDHHELRPLVQNRSGSFTGIGERSAGLQMFVALVGFLAKNQHGMSRPVLLIDEAETHLHYEAQADLIRVLSEQDAVAKVIYTTHSAGCLPLDLGAGIRSVEMDASDRSTINDSFWTAGPGLTPLLMAMGATVLAFTPTRRAVVGEGGTDAILLPRLLREAMGPDHLVDYQVVPGLANATPDSIGRLDLEASRVAFLVDGDSGGRGIRSKLKAAGVPDDSVVTLGGSSEQNLTLEDLVERSVFAEAVNEELRTWQPLAPKYPTSSIPMTGRPTALRTWCRGKGFNAPEKRGIAVRVLEIGRTRSVLQPGRADVLRRLDADLRAVLDKSRFDAASS